MQLFPSTFLLCQEQPKKPNFCQHFLCKIAFTSWLRLGIISESDAMMMSTLTFKGAVQEFDSLKNIIYLQHGEDVIMPKASVGEVYFRNVAK